MYQRVSKLWDLRFQFFSSEWLEHLQKCDILRDPEDDLNRPGRGQQVECAADEANEIQLIYKRAIGHSRNACVEMPGVFQSA
jgi:hypothetical protein